MIRAPGAAMDAPYVQALRVDGKDSGNSWLPADFIRRGGTLEFTLGSAPNESWGVDAAPPSFGPHP